MQLPFAVEQFFEVFRDYNEAVWSARLFLLGLALAQVTHEAEPKSLRKAGARVEVSMFAEGRLARGHVV
jgi:hypothetical protein